MTDFNACHADLLGVKAVEALVKNNFSAEYVKTSQEAKEKILSMVPAGATIGVGGSWTIQETGVLEKLEADGHTIYNHNKPGLKPEEINEFRHQELCCDVFLTGTNALTLDGKLVNVDGAGNRVAAMMFGPKQTIIVTGVNKIVRNVDEGIDRIQLHAAPINNLRLGRPNPCTKTGQCMDCQLPTRICNVTTIMHKRPLGSNIHVIVIGETLGF